MGTADRLIEAASWIAIGCSWLWVYSVCYKVRRRID